MTLDEKWERQGPFSWRDPVEPLAYADWLEERGEDVRARATRWLMSSGKRPLRRGRAYGWKRRGIFREKANLLPTALWEALPRPPSTRHLSYKDYPTFNEAMADVVRALYFNPQLLEQLETQ